MPKQTASGGHNAFTQEESTDFWARRWQADYLAPMLPSVRAATLERAREVAKARPGSYLARNLRRLYGEDV